MIDRVLHYYQTPTRPGFARYMVEQTGLNREQQKLVWELRSYSGNTEFFADRAGLPVKRYNAATAAIHEHMMRELLRLAQLGWEAEQGREP